MGKVKDIIIDAGSLQTAWYGDLQKSGLSKETLAIIQEIVEAEKELMRRRGGAGESRSIPDDIAAEIDRLLDSQSLTSGKLQKLLVEKFGEDRAPSRPTCHRYIVRWRQKHGMVGDDLWTAADKQK